GGGLERGYRLLPDQHLAGGDVRCGTGCGGRGAPPGHQSGAGRDRGDVSLSSMPHRSQIVLEGHIIDSMILPQVMDIVMDLGGNFTVEELNVGQHKTDTSYCRMELTAPDTRTLDAIMRRCRDLGAVVPEEEPAELAEVTQAGVFPEGFYSSTNLPTQVLIGARWIAVDRQEMDC